MCDYLEKEQGTSSEVGSPCMHTYFEGSLLIKRSVFYSDFIKEASRYHLSLILLNSIAKIRSHE